MAASLTAADSVRLVALVGPTTFARGRAYANQGAVVRADWDATGAKVTGLVTGSRPQPYQVTAVVRRAPAGGAISEVLAECTCPVGWNCKHAVAVLLSGPGRSPPERSKAASVWAALVDSEELDEPIEADIAIQFELVVHPPAGRGQSRETDPSRPGVRLRPVVPGQRGWVRSGVSWSRLDYLGPGFARGAAKARLDLLRELRALAGVGDVHPWRVYGDDTIWVESIASRRLWDLLAEAKEAGVALVSAAKGARVVLEAEPLAVTLDLRRQADGTVVADPGLPAGHLLVGRPAHGVIWWSPRPGAQPGPDIHLAALATPLDDPLRGVVDSGSTAVGDTGFFTTQVLPVLRRRVRVVSSDGSVDLPDVGPDRVGLSVAYVAGPAVQASWWLLAAGRPPRPVTDRPDRGASRVLERAAARLDAGSTVEWKPGVTHPTGVRLSGLDAARFATETLPALAEAGVEVTETGDRPDFREVQEAPVVRWAPAPERTDSRDWYDLRVELSVAGEELPFVALFGALAEGATHLLLPSGAYFPLDTPEIRRLAGLIEEARSIHDAPPGTVRLSRYHSSLLEDMAGVGDMAPEVRSALSELAADPMDRPLPNGLDAVLRPYQADGFQWLAARWERGLGAVLADDMGLGKTVQALAVVCHAREAGGETRPFLVVAPTSVVGNWAREAARFAPQLRCVVVTETARKAGTELTVSIEGAGLVVTSYALFRLDHAEYESQEWAGLLLDEAQFAKNPTSHAHQKARRLAVPWKLAMTGTPMENSLSELWAITAITSPGLFGRSDRFEEIYRRPVERHGDTERLEQLRRRIRPWMLRRTKEEVAPELPAKQEQVLGLELDPRHRRLYDTYLQRERQKVLGLLDDMSGNRFEILRSLTMLRQAALDLSLVDPDHAGVPSTKLDELAAMLAGIVADGHRVLVFSQFTRFLDRARRRVEDQGIECCYLDGSTRRRQDVIDRFRSGDAPVFLISLKAGGFGLNLTEADYCILLDPWWNPAAENQAVDRAHRIGQSRPVMVYRLVASGTIEDKVMALRDRKAALFASVMSGGGFESARLDADDVRALLE